MLRRGTAPQPNSAIRPTIGPDLRAPRDGSHTPAEDSMGALSNEGRRVNIGTVYPQVQEDFPTRQQLVSALLLAVATGVAGFLVSYGVFIGRDHRPITGDIDRRAAEGYQARVRKARQKGSAVRSGSRVAYVPYRRPQRGSEVKPKENQQFAQKRLKRPTRRQRMAAAAKSRPSPTPTPKKIAATTQPKKVTNRPSQPGRDPKSLYFPEIKKRPDEVSETRAWTKSTAALARMTRRNGIPICGAVITPDGLMVTKLSTLSDYALRGIEVNGGRTSGEIKAEDPDLDLALVQLGPGTYPALPLCPEPPSVGETLLYRQAEELNGGRFHRAQAVGSAGAGAIFFAAKSPASSQGSPLINRRGELVGIVLGGLRGYPGSNYNVAVDSAALARIVRTGTPGSSREGPIIRLCAQTLMADVPALPGRSKPSRANNKIEPGVKLGNYLLGMTGEQLEKELGKPEKRELRSGVSIWEFPVQKLTFTLVAGRTVAIESDFNFFSTEKGTTVGTPLTKARLKREFPDYFITRTPKEGRVLVPGLEIVIDEERKAVRFILVPKNT